MGFDAVRRIAGEPEATRNDGVSEAIGDTVWIWMYPDVRVEFWGPTIGGIECLSARCATDVGVHIGSSLAQLDSAYGPSRRIVPDSASRTYAIGDSGCWLRFDVRALAVSAVKLECDI